MVTADQAVLDQLAETCDHLLTADPVGGQHGLRTRQVEVADEAVERSSVSRAVDDSWPSDQSRAVASDG